MYPLENIILFEVDKPLRFEEFICYEAGIWFFPVVNTVETVTDDHGNVGYYQYRNDIKYNVNSVSIDGTFYTKVDTIEDLRTTDKSFCYNPYGLYNIYIHIETFEPPLDKE